MVTYPGVSLSAISYERGTVTFDNIPYGTYYVHEESAADDYLPNPIYYAVTVRH